MIYNLKISLIFLFCSGCSFYSFKGSIPPHINSLYISPIDNHTTEIVISEAIKIELENSFINQNILRLLSINDANSQLDVLINSFKDEPYSYSTDNLSSVGYETVNEYRITIRAKEY